MGGLAGDGVRTGVAIHNRVWGYIYKNSIQ